MLADISSKSTRTKSGSSGTSPQQAASEKPGQFSDRPDGPREELIYSSEDWKDFRNLDRITVKAGVPQKRLAHVAIKELVDNALDAGGRVEFGFREKRPGVIRLYVSNDGPGMRGTDAEIAERFSIGRRRTSSKTIRKPTRGMLGNGLRVVAGVVLVSGGGLVVRTAGRSVTLRPDPDGGTTKVEAVEPWGGTGTEVELTLRGRVADDADPDGDLFAWAHDARDLAGGKPYKGRSSAWWYDANSFYELLNAAGTPTIRRLVEELDGCSSPAVAAGVAGPLADRECGSVTRAEAGELLARVRERAGPVSAKRLGRVGRRADFLGYGWFDGKFATGGGTTIPFMVEAWANKADEPGFRMCVNRTPVVTEMSVWRSNNASDYVVSGSGIYHFLTVGRKSAGEVTFLVNVSTPFVPLKSSGKDPDFSALRPQILQACAKAARVAKRSARGISSESGGKPPSQKAIIEGRIAAAREALSGGGVTIFSLRQMYYFIRPDLIAAIGREPSYDWFSKIVGEYEDANGDIDGLYRDDRGTLYHPHTGQSISLGTRSVAGYARPAWQFNKVIYCEKEGFFPMLIGAGFPERHDCALLTSKGFATRAARDVMQLMKKSGEPVVFFCVHDADGPGTVIYDNLRRALEGFGVIVINLGLDPAEGRRMRLSVEPVGERKDGARVPTGTYLPEDDQEWLQKNRIELNAMSTPQFLAWLEAALLEHTKIGKVIPPRKAIGKAVTAEAEAELTRVITAEVVRAAKVPQRVAAILKKAKGDLGEVAAALSADLAGILKATPSGHWSGVTRQRVAEAVARYLADRK